MRKLSCSLGRLFFLLRMDSLIHEPFTSTDSVSMTLFYFPALILRLLKGDYENACGLLHPLSCIFLPWLFSWRALDATREWFLVSASFRSTRAFMCEFRVACDTRPMRWILSVSYSKCCYLPDSVPSSFLPSHKSLDYVFYSLIFQCAKYYRTILMSISLLQVFAYFLTRLS